MKKAIYVLSVFSVLISCHNQKNVLQSPPQENVVIQNNDIINNEDNKQIEQENLADWEIAYINEDKQMKQQYADEIALAQIIMVELEKYFLLNNTYPLPSEGFIIAIEEQITEEAGMVFDYVWLRDEYVLCYTLPDRTGLLFESRYKLWGITINIP
jgi:GH15 family glucan-1,4-alpha-glucosidase